MERHARECQDCRGLIGSLRLMLAGLNALPPPAGGLDALGLAASVRLRLGDPPAP